MSKRAYCAIIATGLLALAFSVSAVVPASAAPAPWWQISTGSHPTNLWLPEDNIQEIETETSEFEGEQTLVSRIKIGNEIVGCLATENFFGSILCEFAVGFPATSTAAQLDTLLEGVYGTTEVDVTGGPAGGEPFVITVHGRGVPPIEMLPTSEEFSIGKATAKVIAPGGSGHLFVTVTNIGDMPVDATETPLTVVDELPEGVEVTSVEAFAGVQGKAGPVECTVEATDKVACVFEETLPSYEAIELEMSVNLLGEPPVAGAPGKVTVSGGTAPSDTEAQPITVSPDPTPFGIERFSAQSEEENGLLASQAGRHPFQLTTTIQLNTGKVRPAPNRRDATVELPALPRNLRFPLPAGLIGNAEALPKCPMVVFLTLQENLKNGCPDESALGVSSATIVETLNLGLVRLAVPVFNLPPAEGEPARLGFMAAGVPVVINTRVETDNDYRIVGEVSNTTQVAELLAGTVVLWGSPGDPRHDASRGWNCAYHVTELGPCVRPPNLEEPAFLRQPVSCSTPLDFRAEIEPWNSPTGSVVKTAFFGGGTMSGCNQVPFNPTIEADPTNKGAGAASGLDFELSMPNAGLLEPNAIAEGQAKKVEVSLPEGVTVNPSQANGLDACTPQDYAREAVDSAPGEGCPEASKVGTVDIRTPLLEEEAHGSVYVASPYDNPFGSLLALYVVARIPERGVLVKQAGVVELNPDTGQLVSRFDNLPQIPFSSFNLQFKEGPRAPLVMPERCGSYDVVAKFTPWNASNPDNPLPSEIVTRTSTFTVDHGANGSACPSGTPPFHPKFTAGTENNVAGSYSPLNVRLSREDGEQEFKTFSMTLPQGVIGNLSGIPFCSEAAIATARTRTGPNGGQEELANPSCSSASQIGRTSVGAGVGPEPTYAPGKVYLAGPYKGAKLSIVAITTAKVGPFDLGNVVIRQPLKVNPDTAAVSTDGSAGDPIPHILRGIVVHARDIRVYVDRKDFVLNPTSCERMSADASVLGSGANPGSSADDQSVSVSSPFQAADCANLGFKPRLALTLRGGTKRGATPRLKAVLRPRKGDANIGGAVVTLPHSEFLEQAHIRTVCTRVQFAAGGGNGEQCPKASVYGRVTAVSPLLDEPLKGPVFLRSSNHPLPDLVAALHSSKVDVNVVGRIDSVRGGIRNSFETVPDAPVTKFTLEMQGGKKGLLVNSTNICLKKHRANAVFKGQNGKRFEANPVVKAKCGGKKTHKKHKRR